MKRFTTVFHYELTQHLRKKSVIVTTLVLSLIVFAATFIPRLLPLLSGGDDAGVSRGYVLSSEADALPGLDAAVAALPATRYASREAMEEALQSKAIKVGYDIQSPTAFETVYLDRTLSSVADGSMAGLLSGFVTAQRLAALGVPPDEVREVLAPQIAQTEAVLGQDNLSTAIIAMALMVVVYMLVLLYGGTTATMVAREKDSKTMELLITSAEPPALILGKVLSSAVAAVAQLGVMGLAGFAGYMINEDVMPEAVQFMLHGTLSPQYLAAYLFYTLIGYLLYLFLYAALGSTVAKVEDVGGATAPIQILFIVGYMVASMSLSNPSSALFRAASIFPFTGVLVMPLRTALATVPFGDHLLAGGLMVVCTAFIAWLAVKIYRWGTLNYGNKTSLVRVIRAAVAASRRK